MKILPYASIPNLGLNKALKTGFKFTNYSLHKTPDNWLFLIVDWTANDKYYWDFKYCAESSCSSGIVGNASDSRLVELEFNKVNCVSLLNDKPYRHKFNIECGIYTKKGFIKSHDYFCAKPNKHGVIVYFSPRNFYDKFKLVSEWRDEAYFNKILSQSV